MFAGSLLLLSSALAADPIIGGQGEYKYQYMPDLLAFPEGAVVNNCHGLTTDSAMNIYLTYEPVHPDDTNCLVRWEPDGTNGQFMSAGGADLSQGTPHGLKIATEDGEEFLYHANNNDLLTKTKLDGTIVWQIEGNFGQDPAAAYRPTWFAVPPNSPYVYLADGYGSSNVYVFTLDGKFTNKTYGGKGTDHGQFQTCHGITYDPRLDQLVVSDRENHRLEYFDFDAATPDKFDYSHTVTMPNIQRPCNIRTYPAQRGVAVVPALEGPVAILDADNKVLSIVNVTDLLGDKGHLHPHDAMLLPNGDLVVATWLPGRLSYWKWLKP